MNKVPASLTAVETIEEAVALLRRTSAGTILCSFIGAVPFWMALLYFLADMSRRADAAERLIGASLSLTALFLWMKCWQTVFAANLRATLSPDEAQPWSVARAGRLVLAQARVQFWGLVARPFAYAAGFPAAWVCAFYQNATVLGDGRAERGGDVTSEAWAQARLWPGQNHALISILSFFSLFVWLNLISLLAAVPFLLKIFLGWETMATRNFGSYLSTTFFTSTVALTFLCVDPVWRAAFVVRCFHGESLRTGADLRTTLSALRRRAALLGLAFLLAAAPFAGAAEPAPPPLAVDSGELNRSIDEVLNRREYAWRTPRRPRSKVATNFFARISEAIERFLKWLEKLFSRKERGGEDSGFSLPPLRTVLWGALIIAAILTILGLWRLKRRPKVKVVTAQPLDAAVPDLTADDISADQLPEDGWMQLARELMQRGELRLALRAAYLAGLAHLGQAQFVSLARHKSNRDYQRELQRRARSRGDVLVAFEENLFAFERSWYGEHRVTPQIFEHFTQNLERMRAC